MNDFSANKSDIIENHNKKIEIPEGLSIWIQFLNKNDNSKFKPPNYQENF